MKKYLFYSLKAFTLIETAMVMVIVGVLAGMTLPALLNYRAHQKQQITIERQEMIMRALASYALRYDYLPCPSTSDETNPNFGEGIQKCREDHTKCIGVLPFKTLGLPQFFAKDGFQYWFSYAVEPELTAPKILHTGSNKRLFSSGMCAHTLSLKILKVRDKEGSVLGKSLSSENSSDGIAVVLISHGPQGSGAFTGQATNRRAVKNKFEQGNCQNTLSFNDFPYSLDPENTFQHRVQWVTRYNLFSVYGQHPCPPINVHAENQMTTSSEEKITQSEVSPLVTFSLPASEGIVLESKEESKATELLPEIRSQSIENKDTKKGKKHSTPVIDYRKVYKDRY